MIQINDNLLQEIGLGALPAEEKRGLLNHIYETLELRVGMRLADRMSNEQLDEFEKYFEAKDDKGAFHWLETNFPNYKDIVQEEFNKLKAEVGQSAPQILQASNQSAQSTPPAQSMATPTAQPSQAATPVPPPQYPDPNQQPLPPQPNVGQSPPPQTPPIDPPQQQPPTAPPPAA